MFQVDPSRPLWGKILSSSIEKVFGNIFDEQKVHIKVAKDKESLLLFPAGSQATIFLTPKGIDPIKSVELTLANGEGKDIETIQTILGSSAKGRKLYKGIRSWCLRDLAIGWNTGIGWAQRLSGIARTIRTTLDDIKRAEGAVRPVEFMVPESAKLIDAVAGTYAVIDINLPINEYGYQHSFCMYINIVDNMFKQLSYIDSLHPHISDSGRFCLDGNFRNTMQDRLAAGDLYSFLVLLEEALMNLNFSDAYRQYPDLVRCQRCEKMFRSDALSRCEICEVFFCSACMHEGGLICEDCSKKTQCPNCGAFVWEDSIIKCHSCDKVICDTCEETGAVVEGSRIMERNFCQDCAPKCSTCGTVLRASNSSICNTCGKAMCEFCGIKYKGVFICSECAPSCDICGGKLPSNHSHTCVECGAVVCCEHAGTRTGSEVVCVTCLELSKIETSAPVVAQEAVPEAVEITDQDLDNLIAGESVHEDQILSESLPEAQAADIDSLLEGSLDELSDSVDWDED